VPKLGPAVAQGRLHPLPEQLGSAVETLRVDLEQDLNQ